MGRFLVNRLFARLLPFFYLGIIVVLFAIGIILFSYLLILGAVVGFILFFATWIKEKFFPGKSISQPKETKVGRTFEHDDR